MYTANAEQRIAEQTERKQFRVDERGCVTRDVAICFEVVSVVTYQPVFARKPHKSVFVLLQRDHISKREISGEFYFIENIFLGNRFQRESQ
ncbi:hypothetical protein BHU16_09490 [Tannerella sp. oral taxon 808]|nr:hypothetical protein BHU16_09490 [Tannerella sp. oral taxon 808]